MILISFRIDTTVSSPFNTFHHYIIVYGFIGLPLVLILMMNLAIVITIATLKPDPSRVCLMWKGTKENDTYCNEIIIVSE